jgi:hypothetical protein
MKKLNIFFDNAPLWQVFIFGWLFYGTFTFLLFQFFPDGTELLRNWFVNLKIGFFMGILFGLITMLMASMSRKSNKFWNYAEEVEALIDDAETKESLQSIFDNEFKTLSDLQQGHPHGSKLKELYAIIKTKYKYAK